MDFLKGRDYPHVCIECRRTISEVAAMYANGNMPDTDDVEAPCNYVYDNCMFCGGSTCKVEDERESLGFDRYVPRRVGKGRHKDAFGRVWKSSLEALCPICGQPDNCGDCTHMALTDAQARVLMGLVA